MVVQMMVTQAKSNDAIFEQTGVEHEDFQLSLIHLCKEDPDMKKILDGHMADMRAV